MGPEETNRQAAKVARGDGGRREHDSAESTTKLRNVESHEEPERVSSCLEVRDDLGHMNRGELLDGLELDDKGSVDEEVEACLPHRSMRCTSSAASTTLRARESTLALGSLRLALLAAWRFTPSFSAPPVVSEVDARMLRQASDLTSTSTRSVL